jgi:hypothetical protein
MHNLNFVDHWKAKYETDMKDVHTRHAKERDMEASIDMSEKEGLRKENARLQKEVCAYFYFIYFVKINTIK